MVSPSRDAVASSASSNLGTERPVANVFRRPDTFGGAKGRAMKKLDCARYALSNCAVAAMLAGCGSIRQAQDHMPPRESRPARCGRQ